jgi:hypothetical protein
MVTKPIIAALRELRSAITQIAVFSALLDMFVVFLISVLVLILISLPWWYGFAIAIVYGAAHAYRSVRRSRNLAHVEEKVPELEEQLITAADNVDKENLVVQSLNEDVIKGMRAIKTSYFLNFGRLTRELITLAVLSVLIITAAAHHISFLDFRDLLKDLGNLAKGPTGPYEITEGLEFVENISEDIYGNKSVEELGGQELRLQLSPMMSDIDIGKTKPPESTEFTSTLPKEIKATTDVSFQESIPKGYQRIVKSYFREIAKTS